MGRFGWRNVLYGLLLIVWFLALILYIKEIAGDTAVADATLVQAGEDVGGAFG